MSTGRWKKTLAAFAIAAGLLLASCHSSKGTHTGDDSPGAAKTIPPANPSAPPDASPVVDSGADPNADPIVGCYQWFNNVGVVIRADHTLAGGGLTASWQVVNAAQRAYQFTWPKSVDTVTIAGGQQALSGMNQYGYSVTGTRIAGNSGFVGTWQWTYSVPLSVPPVVVYADGTVLAGPAQGTWRVVDASRGTYALTWADPPRDSVTLSADGSHIAGADQWGLKTSAVRTGACGGGGGSKPSPATASTLQARPAKLVEMLTYARAVDPTEAWKKGVRTLTAFACQTPQSGTTRCRTQFSDVGHDVMTGYLDVMIYDHELSSDQEFDAVKAMTVEQGDQTPYYLTPQMTNDDQGTGTKTKLDTRCKEEIGSTANSMMFCYLRFDGSTELIVGVKPSDASTPGNGLAARIAATSEATQNGKDAMDILLLGVNLLDKLWAVPQSSTGAFKEDDITNTFGRISFSGAGWYAQRDDIFLTALFGGPYADKKSCVEDLPRAAASAKAQGDGGGAITECDYFQKEP